jgi:PDDEXK-like domain of unknown function (DUF3799)
MTYSKDDSLSLSLYHAQTNRCSASMLKTYKKNPALCAYDLPPTKGKEDGLAFHAVMDGTFTGKYLRGPEGPMNKNPWAAQKKELQEKNPEKIILSANEYDSFLDMADSIYLNPDVGPLIDRIVERECSYTWEDIEGVPCKGRPDAVTDDGTILDFKSTYSLSTSWWRDAQKYQHDLSVAHYLDSELPFTRYIFIVVGKDVAHFVMRWQLSPAALSDAQGEVRALRDAWHESYRTGRFPNSFAGEFLIPRRPSWSEF